MKKIFFILVIVIIVLEKYSYNQVIVKDRNVPVSEERGIFISYIDYSVLKGKSSEEMKSIIIEMINSISYFGLNSIILQTNPFSDAIYPSKVYQSSHTVVRHEGDKLPLDILKFFIEKAKEKNITIYAWMNPYRIRNDNNIGDISKSSYYYKWLKTDNIQISNQGIYLNPASLEVLNYINSGIKELCQNYDIDGFIFDDYYYPNESIDLNTYNNTDKIMNLKDYRINNINKLISTSYDTVKSVNKEMKFGISPAGNIENNLDKEYLDIKSILKTGKIDMIIPQLYYGFNNQSKPYINTLNKWMSLNINNKDFYVALSLYKAGKIDTYAGKGRKEWINNSNIIKKQILISRNVKNYKGFYIFRYEYLFNIHNNENLDKEIINLRSIMNSK